MKGGASPRPPPKPSDDSTDSSTETDRDVSSGEDSNSVEAMTAAFWKVLLNRKRTSKTVKPSAPPYASLFPVAADKAEVGRESVVLEVRDKVYFGKCLLMTLAL